MRELTFGIFIIFSLLTSANSTKPNSTVARAEYQKPDIRVEHLKKYCNVKNWKKKMPDWLMFRTGPGLRRTVLLSSVFSRFALESKTIERLCLKIWNIEGQSSILCMLRMIFK